MPKKQDPQPPDPVSAQPSKDRIEGKDADYVIGGPGQTETRETPGAGPEAEITIGGKKFSVSSEMAQALRAREDDFTRKLNENSNELGELRKLRNITPQPTPVPAPSPKEPNWDTLLFQNPTQALNLRDEMLITQIATAYAQEKAQEKFWEKFYRQNKDLDRETDHFIVEAIMSNNWSELQSLLPAKAQERIAELTREQILGLTTRFKKGDNQSTRAVFERPGSSQPEPAQSEVAGPSSIVSFLKERQKARSAAKAKIKAA